MTVQDALEARHGERICAAAGRGIDHVNCHQCTAWMAVREFIADLAEDEEKALRAGYEKGFNDGNIWESPKDAKRGVAAGIAVLTEGAEQP